MRHECLFAGCDRPAVMSKECDCELCADEPGFHLDDSWYCAEHWDQIDGNPNPTPVGRRHET